MPLIRQILLTIVDWRDANARICFQRKPWYMIQEENEDGREEDTDYSADY